MIITDTECIITVAVANPIAGGDITVSYVASGCSVTPASPQTIAAASVTNDLGTTGSVQFTATRPAVGDPPGSVTFTSTSTDRIPDTDTIAIPAQELRYVGCVARITATSATTVTVTVTASALSGTPTVGLVGLSGSATLNAGHAAGTYTYAQNGTDNVWVFDRGALNAGAGQAQFRAVLSDYQSDDDLVTIEEQGRDTVPLLARARVTATSATSVTARVAVADPYPQGANSVTVTYQDQGSGGVSPGSGGTLTPAATLTEAAGTYIDYTITRPAFGAGTGRVTFTATASGRTSDSDALEIPAQERDTIGVVCRAKTQSTSATQVVARVAVSDPIAQTGQDVTLIYTATGCTINTPASPQTIASASVTADIDTTGTVDVTIDRAAFGTGTGRVTFTASRANRVVATDSVEVPSLDVAVPTLDLRATPGTTSYTITYTVSGHTSFVYSIDGGAYNSVPASGFTISRNSYGGAVKTVTFKAIGTNQSTSCEVSILPQELGSPSLTLGTMTFDSGANTLETTWSTSGMPAGTKYNVSYAQDGSDGTSSATNDVTSPYSFSGVTGATASGSVRVDAEFNGIVIASRAYAGAWAV